MLDTRWVEERDKQITAKAKEDVVFAPGGAIESNLKLLAERRSDIFGTGKLLYFSKTYYLPTLIS